MRAKSFFLAILIYSKAIALCIACLSVKGLSQASLVKHLIIKLSLKYSLRDTKTTQVAEMLSDVYSKRKRKRG